MKVTHEHHEDTLEIRFTDATIASRVQLPHGIVVDLDADKRIVGLRIIDLSENLAAGNSVWPDKDQSS